MSWMSARTWCFDCGTMTECEAHTPLDDLAIDEFERLECKSPYGMTECDAFQLGAEWGAGWAFAIIGMAQAIADNPRYIKLDAERVKRERAIDSAIADRFRALT